jgi:hypothetical protein
MRTTASLLCIMVVLTASAQSQEFRTGTVTESAPIYLLPDANRQPLRVANEGTTLRVLEVKDEWVQVEFADPQLGRRQGYVQARFVKLSPDPNLQPMDLSVSDKPVPRAEREWKQSEATGSGSAKGGAVHGTRTLFVEESEDKDDQRVSECLVRKLTESGKFSFVARENADAIVSLRSTIPNAGKRVLLGSTFGGASKVTLRLRDQAGKLLWEGITNTRRAPRPGEPELTRPVEWLTESPRS